MEVPAEMTGGGGVAGVAGVGGAGGGVGGDGVASKDLVSGLGSAGEPGVSTGCDR
jgi:hypothetical protein